MARFRCRFCGEEGSNVYDPDRHACPNCGSIDVQFAVAIEELPDDHPFFAAMRRLAEPDDHEED